MVVQVNQVEAEYWKKSEGTRVGWSDEILGFFEAQRWTRHQAALETTRKALTVANVPDSEHDHHTADSLRVSSYLGSSG